MGCVIYGLADPVTGALRYVGKTKGSLRKRLLAHINDVFRGRTYIPRHKWIASLTVLGLVPEIFAIEEVSDDGWRETEQFWIAYYRSIGCDLLNATAGGDGIAEHQHSELTRSLQSQAAKRRYEHAEEHKKTSASVRRAYENPEVRAKLSAAWHKRSDEFKKQWMEIARRPRTATQIAGIKKAHTGKQLTSEQIKRLSLANTGRKWTEQRRAKRSEWLKAQWSDPAVRDRMLAKKRAKKAAA